MSRVLASLTGGNDWRLVALAGVLCLLASLVAIALFHRARAARARARSAWLVLAGAASGCGIWATHFIAMIAYVPSVAIVSDRQSDQRDSLQDPVAAALDAARNGWLDDGDRSQLRRALFRLLAELE